MCIKENTSSHTRRRKQWTGFFSNVSLPSMVPLYNPRCFYVSFPSWHQVCVLTQPRSFFCQLCDRSGPGGLWDGDAAVAGVTAVRHSDGTCSLCCWKEICQTGWIFALVIWGMQLLKVAYCSFSFNLTKPESEHKSHRNLHPKNMWEVVFSPPFVRLCVCVCNVSQKNLQRILKRFGIQLNYFARFWNSI